LDLAISISCKLLLRPNNSGLFGSWDFTWENNRATMQSPAASTNPRVGIWQQAQSRWQLVALPDQHGRGRKEICAVRRGRGSHRGRAVPSRSGARGGAGASHGVGVGHPSGAAGRRARKATVRLLSRSRSLSPGGGLAAAACCPGPRAGPRREIQSNHWCPFFAFLVSPIVIKASSKDGRPSGEVAWSPHL
jgi:hypothetical protein